MRRNVLGGGTRLSLLLLAILAPGCATSSYNMPESERTRTYPAAFEPVWEAVSQTCIQLKWSITDRRREDGVISARTGWKMTDARGYEVHILVSRLNEQQTRVEVGAETGSKQSIGDMGGSKARVRDFLEALDERMRNR